MRILFVSHHLKGSDGWSRYACNLIEGVQRTGVEVFCLVNERDEKIRVPQKVCLFKEPLAYVANPVISFFNAMAINRVIKEYRPDIIHILVEPYGAMIPFLRKRHAKIIISVYSTFAFLPALVKGMRKMVAKHVALLSYKKIDFIIPISRYTGEYLSRHIAAIGGSKYIKGKIQIIGGMVKDAAIDAVPRAPLVQSPKEILFVGALKPRKGLVEAVSALARVKTDFIYRIVGAYDKNNPYIKLLKSKITEYKLEDRVVFTGSVSDEELENIYRKADLFLMLSTNNGTDFEGYGLVYIEASGKGVPVIGPNDSGVSDAIIPGKTGYLVDQYDASAVARLIDEMLTSNTISAEDCLSWARENSTEKMAKIMLSLYTRVTTS